MSNKNLKKRKKVLVQINSVCNGSTGKIMGEIQKCAIKNGYECISFFGRKKPFKGLKCFKMNSELFVYLHGALTLLFNNHGMYSYFHTKKLIKQIKRVNPDIIQLHNIHGYYLNYKVLFEYLKKDYKGKVFWTLHDCWSFTGHCAYFSYVKCDKWKCECNRCPQKNKYPKSLFFDSSKREYNRKKKIFNGVNNLTIITPSKWLANLVKKSYLNYQVKVINNGIDLHTFNYIYDDKIYGKYNIPYNKKIILGVSNIWEERKGFNDFIKLAKVFLGYDCVLILVGLSNKQLELLPSNVIGITRTDNQIELVKLYSIADVFVNPTKEEVLGMTNIEAIACGTPVITYNVGGCPEIVSDDVGFVCKSYDDLVKKISEFLNIDFKTHFFNKTDVIKKYDSKKCYKQYINLYDWCDEK